MESSYHSPSAQGLSLCSASPERINAQRSPIVFNESVETSSGQRCRENSVHEKVLAFNTMAFQSKHMEKKTNDAALRRAMLGREEADCEMRKYRDEARTLRKALEEGKRREKIVGERLETVMENFCRSKETFERTKSVWESEIRRVKKENFKTQSALLRIQEELKSSRIMARTVQSDLEIEKYRSTEREQEAFQARLQLAKVQDELSQIQEKLKLVEQERDALRSIAVNEEIARIAAEGQIPLPMSTEDDEFASPKTNRMSFSPLPIVRSAASEEEIENLRMQLLWEQQRACRAHDRIEFLETECMLSCCASRASKSLKDNTGCTNSIVIPCGVVESYPSLPDELSLDSPDYEEL